MVKPQESSASIKDEEYGYTEVREGSMVYDEPGYIKCEDAKAKTKNTQVHPAGDNIVQDQKERYEKLQHLDRSQNTGYSYLPSVFRGIGSRNKTQETACKELASSNITQGYHHMNNGGEAIMVCVNEKSPISKHRYQTSDNLDTVRSNVDIDTDHLKPVSERKSQGIGSESQTYSDDMIVQTNQDSTRRKVVLYVLIGVLYAAVLVLAILIGVVIQNVQNSKTSDVNHTKVQNHVAFMAELSANVTDPAIDFTIVFDKMYTSVGQGYSIHSGRFTAPVRGDYSFNLVASSPTKTATDWLHLFVMKNSEQIGYIFLDDNSYHWMQRSISVVTSLSVGDQVYVKIGGNVADCFATQFSYSTNSMQEVQRRNDTKMTEYIFVKSKHNLRTLGKNIVHFLLRTVYWKL